LEQVEAGQIPSENEIRTRIHRDRPKLVTVKALPIVAEKTPAVRTPIRFYKPKRWQEGPMSAEEIDSWQKRGAAVNVDVDPNWLEGGGIPHCEADLIILNESYIRADVAAAEVVRSLGLERCRALAKTLAPDEMEWNAFSSFMRDRIIVGDETPGGTVTAIHDRWAAIERERKQSKRQSRKRVA